MEGFSEKAGVAKEILPLRVSRCHVPLDIQSTAVQGAGEKEQREPGQAEEGRRGGGRGGKEGGEGRGLHMASPLPISRSSCWRQAGSVPQTQQRRQGPLILKRLLKKP